MNSKSGEPGLLSQRRESAVVLEFDESTGVVNARKRTTFDEHQCTKSDINFHQAYLIERKYRLEREQNPDYRPGDRFATMNFLDDEVLGTQNYDCPQCSRKEGEPCRSMVNYKDARVVDNKNCHKVRRTLALRMQGLGIRYVARSRTYELYSLPFKTVEAQNGSSQGS